MPALREHGIRHLPVTMTRSITPIADLVALWRLYRIMRRERFTIVHCHTPKAELLGQLAARLAGVPIVVDTFRGIYDRAGTGRLRRWLLVTMARHRRIVRRSGALPESRGDGRRWSATKFCAPDRMALLGNGIDVREFDPAPAEPSRSRMPPGKRTRTSTPRGRSSASSDVSSAKKASWICSARCAW